MSKLIEILPNVYGVKGLIGIRYISIYSISENKTTIYNSLKPLITLDGKWKLLGNCTKDEISFDASEVVESTEIDVEQYDGVFVATPRFWDYELESFSCSNSDDSFRSALTEEIKENEKLLILQKLT